MSDQTRRFGAIDFLPFPGILLLFVAVSCTAPPSTAPEPAGDQRIEPHERAAGLGRSPWCDPGTTRRDFGPILSGGDAKRPHRYHLESRTDRPVDILGVVNRKPCCGQVEAVEPVTLAPGQAVDVNVTLHIGLAAGLVSHVAEIQARGDDNRVIAVELVTTAVGLARAAIDVADPARLALEPGESARIELVVRSFGNRENPPFPLNDRAIRCDTPVEWVGAEEARTDPDSGLDERLRRLVMTLNASGEPGRRSAFLELRDGGATAARKMLAWEVSPAIKAVPPGLVLSEDTDQAGRFLL